MGNHRLDSRRADRGFYRRQDRQQERERPDAFDMTLGVIGGFLGDEIFQAFGCVSEIYLWSILVAVIGSSIVLTLHHGIVHV